jgi:putative transcriptional regulator
MAKVRLKNDGRLVAVKRGRERALKPRADWKRVDATSEKEIARQAEADETAARRDAAAYARQVRARTKLSQAQFAERIGVPVETVRNWEQGKRSPRGPARALLKVIDKAPSLTFDILGPADGIYASAELIAERIVENARDEMETRRSLRLARKRRR